MKRILKKPNVEGKRADRMDLDEAIQLNSMFNRFTCIIVFGKKMLGCIYREEIAKLHNMLIRVNPFKDLTCHTRKEEII
jgi:hypothetical protein